MKSKSYYMAVVMEIAQPIKVVESPGSIEPASGRGADLTHGA